MTDQEFQIEMTKQVTGISGQLSALVESNKRQDQLFDEHRANMKKSLADHQAEVRESLEKIDNKFDNSLQEIKVKQADTKAFIDRAIGVLLVLTFVVPVALTTVEVSTLLRGQEMTEMNTA